MEKIGGFTVNSHDVKIYQRTENLNTESSFRAASGVQKVLGVKFNNGSIEWGEPFELSTEEDLKARIESLRETARLRAEAIKPRN